MGIKRCAVSGCQSAKNRPEDLGVTFHQLPANQATRVVWVAAARVPDENNIKVCSRHFREADFKLVSSKYFLIKGSYPTIFPWGVYTHNPPTATDDTRTNSTPEDTQPPEQNTPIAPEALPTVTEAPKPSAARVKREPPVTKRHSIAVETLKKEVEEEAPKTLRKSMEASLGIPKREPEPVKKVDPVPGTEVSAMDFQNVWHKATILEVDSVEREVLIHFEENNQQK